MNWYRWYSWNMVPDDTGIWATRSDVEAAVALEKGKAAILEIKLDRASRLAEEQAAEIERLQHENENYKLALRFADIRINLLMRKRNKARKC